MWGPPPPLSITQSAPPPSDREDPSPALPPPTTMGFVGFLSIPECYPLPTDKEGGRSTGRGESGLEPGGRGWDTSPLGWPTPPRGGGAIPLRMGGFPPLWYLKSSYQAPSAGTCCPRSGRAGRPGQAPGVTAWVLVHSVDFEQGL